MGTNYYLKLKENYNKHNLNKNVLELTNGYVFKNTYYKSLEELNEVYCTIYHIGKDSSGWRFLLGSYADRGIKNLEDWCKLFDEGTIYDEYENVLTKNEMLELIKNKDGYFKDENEENYLKQYNLKLDSKNLIVHNGSDIIFNSPKDTYDIINHSNFS